jgi:hypothetical protein
MSKLRFHLSYAMLLMFCLPAYEVQSQDTVPLPVKKVELYKNGMGYFEHLGTVKGQQNVEIVLPSSQLNDVLKSLTVLDLGHGQIGGVTYDSIAPLARRLAELPIDLSSAKSMVDFLNQIQGAGLEIRTPGGPVIGKLMGAEIKTKSTGPGVTVQEVQVNVLSDSGQIHIVEMESAGALKLTDQTLARDLSRYLDLLDTSHQRNVRRLRIQTLGTGERQLYISYTSESPIWKTTYRIVLDPKQKPLLQGWAIVDNTTPMDWLNVSLSLVAGAPISFVQDLSQPIYGRRPVVPLPQGVEVSPQAYESAIETADTEAPMQVMRNEVGGMGGGGFGGGAAGGVPGGKGGMMGEMRMKAAAPSSAPAPPPRAFAAPSEMPVEISDAIRQQATSTAQAHAVAEQFEYKIRQPVTIRRNESALLPILQSDVGGEKVSVFKATDNEQHPRLAFWLKNSSGATLDAGPVTVIDTNAFAGEGLIETVQPGESRLLSYAVDLGTVISTTIGSEHRRVERVVINQGAMRLLSKMVDKKTYKIRNNNDAARTIILEHPVRPNWKIIGTTPLESSANYYRFKVEAKAKSTADFIVQEESPIESVFSVSSITPERIAVWIQDRSIDPEIEKSLKVIVDKKTEVNDLAQKIAALDKEQNDIFRDQERVRGNLQRLNQTPDEATLRQRYVRQLDGQENRLASMKAEREKLEVSRLAAQKQLDDLIQKLSLDKKI